MGMCGVCAGVRGYVWICGDACGCAGVRSMGRCGRVCTGVAGCAQVCASVHCCAQVCVEVCGCLRVWGEFSEYLLEDRV